MAYAGTTWTLGTDSSGYAIPGTTYRVASVFTVPDMKLRKDVTDKLIFSRWIGKKGEFSPIIHRTELTKKKGETIRLFTLPKLDAAGVPGDGYMEGSEEMLEFAYVDVTVNQIRNAVMEEGKASSQRGMFNIVESARPALTVWLADKIEDSFFRTIYYGYPPHVHTTAATFGLNLNSHVARPPEYWYCADEGNNTVTYSATDATYESSIETAEGTLANVATDFMSPNILEGMGVKMRVLNIPRISFNGFSGYLCVLHPYQVSQLRTHSDWFNANITAGPRDKVGNPVFAGVGAGGEVGIWNDFYIMESNKIATSAQAAVHSEVTIAGAAEANVRRAICMGAGAVAFAEADKAHMEVDDHDYGNKTGVAVVSNWGMGRTDYLIDSGARSAALTLSNNLMVVSTYSPAATV